MEIRCSNCEHLGAAAEVRAVDGGVGLVCSACGHVNVAAADPAGRDGVVVDADGPLPEDQLSTDALKRLIPEEGSGQRCRKCLHLLEQDERHCSRCGLSVAEAAGYGEGEAPWEQPPEGKEDLLVEARALFEAAIDDSRSESIGEFVEFSVEQGLIDSAIRQLQRYLVEHGEDAEALAGLARLAKSLEAAVSVARSRAESKADQFQDDVEEIRSKFLLGALIFWVAILLLFSWLFWANF